MKKIVLVIVCFMLCLSLVGCKPENTEDETENHFCHPTTIVYSDYDHFYLDMKLSQRDYSALMYLHNDCGYTYIPSAVSDGVRVTSVRIDRHWFLYSFESSSDPTNSEIYFVVRVYRTSEEINNVKEFANIKPTDKYVHQENETSDNWFIVLDDYVLAQVSFYKGIKLSSFDELDEYVTFEIFNHLDTYSPENAVENIDRYIGASYKELDYAFLGKDSFQYANFVFIKATDKKNVVAELDSEHKNVVDIRAYRSVSPSHEDFEEITDGMSVFDVVERVGIPFGSFTSGVDSLSFKASDGSVYMVVWDMNMKVSEVSLFSTET